jgi:hypothetical protein
MPSLSMNESLQLMICLDSWMVCCLPLSALPSLRCKTRCIVGITVTQWLIICLLMVLIVQSSFVLSTFPKAGMMAQSQPMFCLVFIRRLAHTKCVLIKAFLEAVMLLMFLLDPLVTHKPIDLLLICIRTCYIYLTFMFLYAKQVNEV